MSFYLSYTNDIKKRKASHVFYFKDDVLYTSSKSKEVELISFENKNKDNLMVLAINYIKSHDIHGFEILLPSLDERLLDEACDYISKYLLENDDSIGLLTDNPHFREDYSWIIDKYGITYSAPIEPFFALFYPKVNRSQGKPKEKCDAASIIINPECKSASIDDLESGLDLDEPFNAKLIRLLNESGKSNSEVYTKGGITRQVFSNILSKKDCIPRKDTVICLIIGMELNYIDGIKLLNCAGYALSKSIVSDVVVTKYLKQGVYDLDIINNELDERGCSLLGWKPRDN